MTLIYGIPPGETERYTETLLSTQCKTDADAAALKARAAADGFHSFRTVEFHDGERPDFSRVVSF